MCKKLCYVVNILLSIFLVSPLWIKKKINRKKIWLFGAGNGCYENNISHFHDYVLKNESPAKTEVFFVTTSHNLLKSKKFKTLIRGKAFTYAMSIVADYLVIDTCNSDISPGLHKLLGGLKINVNHGFEGFKKLPPNYYANIDAHIQCASSEKEKEIKVSMCGADKSTVFVTGYPRFDNISEYSGSEIRKILYFPTWRSWLEHVSVKELDNTEYVLAVKKFLGNEELKAFLRARNITLYYKPHHKISHLALDYLESDCIQLLKSNDNLTEHIQSSDLLITDYSSVAWDFLYNNRKVLFYIFDIETYIKEQGLYYDVRALNYSNYSLSSDGVVSLLQEYSSALASKPSNMALDFFKYKDSKNCERLMSLILEK
uniref:CDP-glycerol:poly(Glycerophosphate) glycerophosphotransferase n=1 Tax=Enterobacter cloacae TaxID=550 RepID=A0A6B9XYC0_ENTCL|nr:CDP-glycerol:poly(glycerophosphate) glycerophosphotransferase [Enterobacter cloacae]